MTDGVLSDEVVRFIFEHIHSVEQLEILLLLRSRGEQDWSATEVSDQIRTGPDSAAARLEDLRSRGLIAASGGSQPRYRYQPRTPELERAVTALAAAYGELRYTVINQIFSKPLDKIRVFADAFRFRKDDDERNR